MCNVNFARKCSLTHLQAQRKFTSAGCHPQVGTAIQYSTYVQCVRTVRLYSTSIEYVRTALYMYRYPVRIGCTVHSICVYPARRKCQTVELLRQRKKAAESCNGNLRRMPFRDVYDGTQMHNLPSDAWPTGRAGDSEISRPVRFPRDSLKFHQNASRKILNS
jgi:hypothetical protein